MADFPLFSGLIHLLADGGPWVGWIFASGVLMWGLTIERYYHFHWDL